MIIDVCVIGVGGIGKFHLRSAINAGFHSVGLDPLVQGDDNCKIVSDFKEILDYQVRVFIISTNANLHFAYLERIHEFYPKSAIVIEKPLFSTAKEYRLFNEINQRHDGNIYVNLPFLYSAKFLPYEITDLGNLVSYQATGGNWGLGCNILHDISILTKIKGKVYSPKKVSTLVISVLNSKREGYYELLGTVKFLFDNVSVELNTSAENNGKIIKLCFEKGAMTLDFNLLTVTSPSGQYPLIIPRASDETGLLVNKILGSHNLDLLLAEKYILLSDILYENMSSAANITENGNYPFS